MAETGLYRRSTSPSLGQVLFFVLHRGIVMLDWDWRGKDPPLALISPLQHCDQSISLPWW